VLTTDSLTVRVWDLGGRLVTSVPGDPKGWEIDARILPGGDVMAVEGPDYLRLWSLRDEEILRVAEERITRELTTEERELYRDLLGEENRVRLEAARLVADLHRDYIVAEVKRRVRKLEHGPLRYVALQLVENLREDAETLNDRAWEIVKSPKRSEEAYARGLRLAEGAVQLARRDGLVLNTLGVAQYRARRYAEALATLTRSSELNGGKFAEDAAFLAMANHHLGQTEEAKRQLDRAKRLARTDDTRALVEEAVVLIEGEAR
jgi:tetratricopeptide (TPR) repeat protein